MVAFSSCELMRVFGCKGEKWKMLMNKKPSSLRKINALKWCPDDRSRIAVAAGDGHLVTIDFLDFKGRHFKRVERFEVPQAGSVSCISWSCCGKYLMAAIKRDARHPDARMVIIKKQGNQRYNMKTISYGYQSEFISVFHSTDPIILSASARSTDILLWAEDVKSFGWTIVFKISIGAGITDMCMSDDGNFLAAIVEKRLMIWKYCCVDVHESSCFSKLEEIQYENDDDIKRKKGVSLSKHCENIISLKWSSELDLLTGSSVGTICVHTHPALKENVHISLDTPFEVLYFRWSYVHAHNKSGPVKCVSWIPRKPSMLAVAGNDGVVIVWELVDADFDNPHNRNYMKEINYFYPGRRSSVGDEVLCYDVASIESIPDFGSTSSFKSEDTSDVDVDDDRDEVEDEQDEEQDQTDATSTAVRLKVQHVLEKQVDLESTVSEVFNNVQDVLEKLRALEEIADGHDDKLFELVGSHTEAKEKQEEIEESVGEVMLKLQDLEKVIENTKTELTSMVQLILPRLATLEGEVKLHKAEVIAAFQGVIQKPVEQEEMTKKEKFELVSKIQEMLQCHKVDVFAKQNKMEASFLAHCQKLDTTFVHKHNSLEQNLIRQMKQLEESMQSRLHLIEEENLKKHNEMTEKFDTMIGLLQKLSDTSSQ